MFKKMILRAFAFRTLRIQSSISTSRKINIWSRPRLCTSTIKQSAPISLPPSIRRLSAKTLADEKIDDITELFSTAKDEFEIAMEETEKVSVYAEEDRKAAREELTKVQEAYKNVVEGSDQALAEEVKTRVGQRIRELEQGVANMEEMALNQD